MTTSIDAKKAFDKIQRPFVTKTVNQRGREGMHLSVTKATQDKPTADVLLTAEG